MSTDDKIYYKRRSVEERIKASQSSDPATAHAHYEMAQEYERRSKGEIPRTIALANEMQAYG